MWSLRQKEDGEFFLTFDRSRRFTNNLRGLWEYVGPQDVSYTTHAVKQNERNGLLCCKDDEGAVRVLILEN